MRRSNVLHRPRPSARERFGLRSLGQLRLDLGTVVRKGLKGEQFQFDPSSLGHLRPAISLPAYAGFIPDDRRAPIINLFDRTAGGQRYSQRVSKRACQDFRGQALTYDEHDGVDFVCPPGTPLVAAAPGTVVLIRHRWLRGGLTVTVDHGFGVTTQYTHCSRALLPVGARVGRGQVVALSGSSGLDMTAFFPWVPPHVHFMSWVDGRPIDPFVTADEAPRPGIWIDPHDPRPARPRDPSALETSAVEYALAREVAGRCGDPQIQAELDSVIDAPASLAALLEDALHHDRFAFPEADHLRRLRPADARAAEVRLSMPLPHAAYVGSRFADP